MICEAHEIIRKSDYVTIIFPQNKIAKIDSFGVLNVFYEEVCHPDCFFYGNAVVNSMPELNSTIDDFHYIETEIGLRTTEGLNSSLE